MRIGRVLGVVLSILVVGIILNYAVFNAQGKNNPFELVQANEVVRDGNTFAGNQVLDMENTEEVEILTFTNKESHSVMLNKSSIQVVCHGSGEHKEHDEALVERNLKIKASFSATKKGLRHDSLSVEEKGEAYIFINSSYEGDEYPLEEVSCKYNIQIQAS